MGGVFIGTTLTDDAKAMAMKLLLGMTAFLLATVALAFSQPPAVRVITDPRPPSRESLERLNLRMGWKATIPLKGRRDGLFSVQIFGEANGTILVVQSISGALTVLDGETGDLLWRVQVDDPFVTMQPVGTNGKHFFTSRRDRLYFLDRANGKHVVYDVHKDTGLPLFGFKLEGVPAVAPVADEEQVYIVFGSKVTALTIPNFEAIAKAEKRGDQSLVEGLPPRAGLRATPQPELAWNYVLVHQQIQQAPLLTPENIGLITTDGTLHSINRIGGLESFKYKVNGPIQGKAAQTRTKVYLGSEDYVLYDFDLANARLNWRLSTGAMIVKNVEATGQDIFVVPEKVGLMRVDRAAGEARWANRNAVRLLAVNDRFVYAADRHENLLVLDYNRGTTMARLENHDYMVPVTNDLTDRIYLANHDGQILCLHHRDLQRPLKVKYVDEKPIKPKGPKGKKEEPKENPDKDKMDKDDKEKMDKEKADKEKLDKEKKDKGARVGYPPLRSWEWREWLVSAPVLPVRTRPWSHREDQSAAGAGT